MLKLYRFSEGVKEYWETWKEDSGIHVLHWGQLGTKGELRNLKFSLFRSAKKIIKMEVDSLRRRGFDQISPDDHAVLMIEYKIEGMGDVSDIDKRHRLEHRMNETLGWTGLGECDGGSIGSGTMEVCNFVVDFELAKQVIERDLADTEFANFTRIYNERDS